MTECPLMRLLHHHVPESDEGVAQLAANDVDAAFRDGQAVEEVPDVRRSGRPRQVLQANDHAHSCLFIRVVLGFGR